jgi:hypothetical protein
MQIKKINLNLNCLLNTRIAIIAIIVILTAVWIGGSLIFNNKYSFSLLKYGYDNQLEQDLTLYKNQKIIGEFKSKDNFLGIVFIKFSDFVIPSYRNEDMLEFRIKEKDAKDWYYVNNFKSGFLKTSLHFPFGFPTIEHSKDKIYIFEIESLNGNERNAVNFDRSKNYISTGHKYNKAELISSTNNFINYSFTKLHNSFTDTDYILSSLFYALPLIFYLLWLILHHRVETVNKILLILFFAFVIADTFFIENFYQGIYFGLIIVWIFCIKLYRYESSVNFLLGFLAFLLGLLSIYFQSTQYTEKLNIWTYTFLFIGAMQVLVELKFNLKNREDFRKFIKGFLSNE